MPVFKDIHAFDLGIRFRVCLVLNARSRIHMPVFKDMRAPDLGFRV